MPSSERRQTRRYAAAAFLLIGVGASLAGRPLVGQVTEPGLPTPLMSPQDQPTPATPVTPGGAFLRAMAVPGWGHAALGEHTRGGIYVVAQSGTGWMLVRTRARLSAAKRVLDLYRADVRSGLLASGVDDPREIALAQNADPRVVAAAELVEARSQQFEDWLALGLFVVFLGGVDAFVSAHLKDFPDPVRLTIERAPNRVDFGLSLVVR